VLPSRNLYRLALNRWRLPANRVRHVPNGIDCARFAAIADPIAVPSGSGPVIGTVAALRPEKNIGRLLRAFRLVLEKTPCRLVVAGEGRDRAALEQLAGETLPPESVLFIGHIHEVERVYSSLDVFALSSDTEQMPTALMEAMAAGLPAVSTDVGDVSEMVAAANRPFIVPPNDSLFAEALHRLVTDPGMRRTVGAANREAANSHFEIARMFSDYDRLFSSTANTRSQ
jgi:glycosyltransferase involved in cell wall biosynthesis